METEQAQRIIKKAFENEFSEESFKEFLTYLLNKVDLEKPEQWKELDKVDWGKERSWSQGQYIYSDYQHHIRKFRRMGIYTSPRGEEVEILVVETQTLAKLDRARTSLRNFVVKWLQDENNKSKPRDYALAAFYAKEDGGADWRFSFIKVEHEIYQNDVGKVKIRKELTPSRRYSYLVGTQEKSYTAQKQFLPLIQRDYAPPYVDEIEKAFGIETVTQEFFQQYRGLYDVLFTHLAQDLTVKEVINKDGLDLARFTKKLLGQIVFLYFLQKKGWLGVPREQRWGQGKKAFMRELFDKAQIQQKEFYQHYLQYLFYEALAKERTDKKDPAYYPLFDCKIPFLNGGLFEADYHWQNNPISIPDHLFSNTIKNKVGDIGTGILDVFDRYNFTIKEDEPLEKEVAVDPEMLGKVFENMLDDDERKSKGAFYTPREIVYYMCQESLIHYLDSAINKEHSACSKEDLEILIRKGSLMLENDKRVLREKRETKDYKFLLPQSIRTNAKLLDKKLEEIKICDPAIGSGAFPVGLLNEIVNVRLVLQPFINTIQDNGLESTLSYCFKRHAIQESIYGVDIDASAVDIARLRLWLSLIVEEEVYENITALPNLDYKIMQGNSLISDYMGIRFDNKKTGKQASLSFTTDDIHALINEFKQKKDMFTLETNRQQKEQLRKDIDDLLIKIFETRLEKEKSEFFTRLKYLPKKYMGIKDEAERNVFIEKEKQQYYSELGFNLENVEKQLREYSDERKSKPFFLWELYFAEIFIGNNPGFDLVIGNPPYIRQEMLGVDKDYFKKHYSDVYHGVADIYVYFIHQGMNILKEKGSYCIIVANKWMRANYGEPLRKFLKQKRLLKLVDFGDLPVFQNATTYPCILLAENTNQPETFDACNVPQLEMQNLATYLQSIQFKINPKHLQNLGWLLANERVHGILDKINAQGIPLGKYVDGKIFYGIKTGLNEAFVINEETKDQLIKDDPRSAELIKPFLAGREVKQYEALEHENYLIFTRHGVDINKYPAILKYLFKFKEQLMPKPHDYKGKDWKGRKGGPYQWYEIQDTINYYMEFEKPKIIYPNICSQPEFTYDEQHLYTNQKCFIIPGSDKYLLGFLNSSVSFFLFRQLLPKLRGGFYEPGLKYMELFPIKQVDQRTQKVFETVVDYILFLKKNRRKIYSTGDFFEAIVDGLIFELYFPDEFKREKIEILKLVADLPPLSDIQSDEEKVALIKKEFECRYDPYHPVRNNLFYFSVMEDIRIIKGTLK